MTAAKKQATASPRWPGGWTAVLGCSSAALSLFRICLGVLLTLELVLRFRFLHPFYSDEGTLPLNLLMNRVDDTYKTVCVHCHFGELWQQQLLLGLQVVLAVLLTLGIRTRPVAIASWYLYLSLTLRNTWMNYILDRYFHYLLFLSMFLPLDARWSLQSSTSAKGKTEKKNPSETTESSTSFWYISPATVALKALVVWIYWDAGYGKYADPEGGWSYSADPLPALDTYARHTTFAQYLYALLGPEGLRLMTPTVVWVELLAAPVTLLGSYLGSTSMVVTAIALISSMHVGIALALRNAALLSFVACTVWVALLPLDRYYNNNSSNTKTAVKTSGLPGTLVSLLLIGSMLAGNLWLETISQACDQSVKHIWSTLLHNRWNVFVGAETYVTWEIAPGQLADGSIVDVWGRRNEVNWNLPGGGAPCTATARPGRWRSFPYLAGLEGAEGEALWRYLCNEWDRENDIGSNPERRLIKYNFFMLQADVLPEMQFSATRKRLIVSYDCVPPNATTTGEGESISSSVKNARATMEEVEEVEVIIPAGEPTESAEPKTSSRSSSEPEVPRESDVPTEEPEYIDPDRSEPVPGESGSDASTENEETESTTQKQRTNNEGDESHEPEVPRAPDVPTEEPEYIDPDRSEPVPGDAESTNADTERTIMQEEKESREPEVPKESDVPTEEPEYVDPDKSEPVPGNQGDEL